MSGIYADDRWSLLQAEVDGKPIIIRARASLPSEGDRERFPTLVIVTWPYDANDQGMPESGVAEQMAAMDESLASQLEGMGVAVEVASLTGNAAKQWRFYATDADAFMNAVNASLQGHPTYPLEFNVYADPSWTALAELVPT